MIGGRRTDRRRRVVPVSHRLAAAAVLAAVLVSSPAGAQTAEAVRTRVEQLHDAPATPIAGVRLLRPDAVAHFFEARDFRPAWAPAAAAEILQAIHTIDRDGLTPADYHLALLESLTAGTKTAPAEDVQLLLADAVAALVDDVSFGKVRPRTLDPRWNVDPRRGTPALETLVDKVAASPTASTIESLKPGHFIYTGLRSALARYRAIAAGGGWGHIPPGPAIKPGAASADPRLPAIRARLAASGDLAASEPAGDGYDAALQAAVKAFQERHRLAPDGVIGKTTIDEMNVSAAARVDQIRVNLERVRWVIAGEVDSFVLVNLPAFKVYVIREHKNVWEGRTMIGKQARQTPAFRADMRYVVFNPDWTVPPTILAKDVLEGMRKGENTIARKNLTIIDRQGHVVPPDSIDWTTVQPRNFPYTLRQPPGEDNALGRVKFIFPNEHSIFLHDTPHREGFSSDLRTFSSGCIRLERPLELAASLLADQPEWTPARIDAVVASGKSQTVFLKQPLPVMIVYWTVSVGSSGDLHFARDVYDRDAPVLRGLAAR
jgi:L,D-transpeptidase YcbB